MEAVTAGLSVAERRALASISSAGRMTLAPRHGDSATLEEAQRRIDEFNAAQR